MMMKPYDHFKTAVYLHAYDLEKLEEEELREYLYEFCTRIHLDKVYIENHRGRVDIPLEKFKMAK